MIERRDNAPFRAFNQAAPEGAWFRRADVRLVRGCLYSSGGWALSPRGKWHENLFIDTAVGIAHTPNG